MNAKDKVIPIKFGTDGWRDLIARNFTFDNVAICAAGYARYLKETGAAGRGIVIGYDTRFLSADFALETAMVLNAAGIRVSLSREAVPTPTVSFSSLKRNAGGAVVITASHNPGHWNGFKIKSASGSSAPPEEVAVIEKHIRAIYESGMTPERLSPDKAAAQGLLERVDLAPPYLENLGTLVDLTKLRQSDNTIMLDSMHGAGAGYFRRLLGEDYPMTEIKGEINPAFPGMQQPEPIDGNLTELKAAVVRQGVNVGLATDGDADRLGVVDERGNFVTQLQVMSLLAMYLLEVRGQRGAIIKTITTSAMLNKLAGLYGVPIFETAVGFKNIAPLMERENAIIGGEESGGYGFRNHVLERDAMLAGLYFLDFMAATGKTPSELLADLYSKVDHHDYNRIDIGFDEAARQAVMDRLLKADPDRLDDRAVVKDTIDGFRFTFEDGAWLLIRASGTEPLLRIYAEADSMARVNRLLELGKQLAGV
ncbi:MAG: phosphoglucomutase/phosphomannomutase family protein [Dehalogenimonas sp.]|uniref:Phosphoglucomutase/phosphomannomutase family protein n=1 Tax=Candidatus Dehalogenimonas loeffleri TaxID=3127115 RepID=A0ABZ2J5X5_9CHLR|nr:phosphoglucomutase/phosphomannomutase family protein [Dehalogenimonas sp.]